MLLLLIGQKSLEQKDGIVSCSQQANTHGIYLNAKSKGGAS